MDLPKNIKSFIFESTGDTTAKKYDGEFKVKCTLNMMDKRLLEIEKCAIRADIKNPTGELVAYATILATLRIRIEDSPEWWKQSNGGYDLLDENIIVDLFDKVMEKETEWREELQKQADPEGNPQKEN